MDHLPINRDTDPAAVRKRTATSHFAERVRQNGVHQGVAGSSVSRRALIAGAGATVAAVAGIEVFRRFTATPVDRSSMPQSVIRSYDWAVGLDSDFTTAKKLNPKVWQQGWFAAGNTAISGPINENETAAYDPKNLTFAAEGLQFAVTDTPVGGRPHSGAGINTRNLVSLTPGCWAEARLHLPGRGGVVYDWPGFWLNGYDTAEKEWPQYGEIDIVEGLGGEAAWHYHWGERAGVDQANLGGAVAGDHTGWHVFAAHWESDRIDIYFDGGRVGSVKKNVQSDPHYLILGHSTSSPGRVGSELVCSSVRTWTHT